ncbi:hypothetical protein DFR72_105419 [Lentzea flaviverrucosa]|uniref:Uncharacterized protein n=1 Tax=Lentzea flaviverrucosa TaxID=200379 RepID=A0A1H9P2B0_9PSEU|nr:hypothetical protein DFR72_105419 [Lentzea flaviverrucosa]SER42366.1 hypothetical protein SAMN05216195_105153 [Lentzea flaviverrucosa]
MWPALGSARDGTPPPTHRATQQAAAQRNRRAINPPVAWTPDQIAGVWGRAPGKRNRKPAARKATTHKVAPTRRSLLGKLIQNRLQIRGQNRHQEHSRHLVILVNNKGRRHTISRDSLENVDKTPSRSIINRRISKRSGLHEIPRILLRRLLDIQPDDLSPGIEDLLHLRSLSPARPTPGAPDVDHDGLPGIIRKPDDLPVLKQRLPFEPLQRLALTNRVPNLDLPPRSHEIEIPGPDLGSIFTGSASSHQQQQNQKPLHAPVTRGSVAPTGSV